MSPGTAGRPQAEAGRLPVVALFGPTAVGKTAVAIELARLIAGSGGEAVAVNCDSIQVYRGLEVISGAADAGQQALLEHRLISFVPVDQEFSAGQYAGLARAEIDSLLEAGKCPVVVGGTGLYLRGALTDMEFRPPVSGVCAQRVEEEIDRLGAAAVHAGLPAASRGRINPNDRARVARAAELLRSGQTPAPDHRGGGELWTAELRRPTLLVGLVDEPEVLAHRITERVAAMAEAGAGEEARVALEAGASRTARAAIGFDEFLAGDLELAAAKHRRLARRQMTWMRRMDGVGILERSGRGDRELALAVFEAAQRLAGPARA